MGYNPRILEQALAARFLSRGQLAKRLNMSPEKLEESLERDPHPSQKLISKISKELSLPSYAFYMSSIPKGTETLPDFRSEKPHPIALSKDTVDFIQTAKSIQRAASMRSQKPLIFPLFLEQNIEIYAQKIRELVGISLEDQIHSRNPETFYTFVRKKIEDLGIFVIHGSYDSKDGSGFCISDPNNPIIGINTKDQTRARQLFTLVHELAHVIIGASGISDPFITKNALEKRCNRFAAAFLFPKSLLEYIIPLRIQEVSTVEAVRKVANVLKISLEATVIRLEQLKIFPEGTYDQWKASVHNANPDSFKRRGGGKTPPPQYKVKLAKYGFHFARAFNELLDRGYISEINLYRHTGLKPAYLKEYFGYVKGLDNNELRNMELSDE